MNEQTNSIATYAEHIIIGAGFGGLCLAAKLLQQGQSDMLLLEKADEVGGTWRENRYPGAECDIPSSLYSYSFWPNPTWDFKWAKQKQILDYLVRFTDTHNIRGHIRFGQALQAAEYIDTEGQWALICADGQRYRCRFLTFAIGQLHHPKWPDIVGIDEFKGPSCHSAQWPEDLDVSGKKVGIIGNAASAIQMIPELAKTAGELVVYQRSANWIVPKPNRPYSKLEKGIARRFPGLAALYRAGLWSLGEYGIYPMIQGRWPQAAIGAWLCRWAINNAIDDDELKRKLLPDYPIGAKRILFSTKYYPALARDNVTLVTEGVERITADAVQSSTGTVRQHDILLYATGFHTNPFMNKIEITGANATRLTDHWQSGAQAYLGVMTAGFPNLFMLYGPNTNTGHTSVVYKLEAQVKMILQLVKHTEESGLKACVSVSDEAEERFNDEMQTRLQTLAWAKIDQSWYKDGDRITNNWPGSSLEYRRRTEQLNWQDFKIS